MATTGGLPGADSPAAATAAAAAAATTSSYASPLLSQTHSQSQAQGGLSSVRSSPVMGLPSPLSPRESREEVLESPGGQDRLLPFSGSGSGSGSGSSGASGPPSVASVPRFGSSSLPHQLQGGMRPQVGSSAAMGLHVTVPARLDAKDTPTPPVVERGGSGSNRSLRGLAGLSGGGGGGGGSNRSLRGVPVTARSQSSAATRRLKSTASIRGSTWRRTRSSSSVVLDAAFVHTSSTLWSWAALFGCRCCYRGAGGCRKQSLLLAACTAFVSLLSTAAIIIAWWAGATYSTQTSPAVATIVVQSLVMWTACALIAWYVGRKLLWSTIDEIYGAGMQPLDGDTPMGGVRNMLHLIRDVLPLNSRRLLDRAVWILSSTPSDQLFTPHAVHQATIESKTGTATTEYLNMLMPPVTDGGQLRRSSIVAGATPGVTPSRQIAGMQTVPETNRRRMSAKESVAVLKQALEAGVVARRRSTAEHVSEIPAAGRGSLSIASITESPRSVVDLASIRQGSSTHLLDITGGRDRKGTQTSAVAMRADGVADAVAEVFGRGRCGPRDARDNTSNAIGASLRVTVGADSPGAWRSSSFFRGSADVLTAVPASLLSSDDVTLLTQWGFDTFEFSNRVANPLVKTTLIGLIRLEAMAGCKISMGSLSNFLTDIESGYASPQVIPYHNALHATDVVQCCLFMCEECGLTHHLSSVEALALLIGAAVHDYQHPGVNNNFLIATSDVLALRYNDKSVLENHHVAAAFTTMRAPANNFMELMPEVMQRKLRHLLVSIVLATDLAMSFEVLSKFELALETAPADTFDYNDVQHKRLVLQMAIKCGDTSGPARPFDIHVRWSLLIMEEFFLQGDKEKALGLPVDAMMDRTKEDLPTSQINFIQFVARPIFKLWVELIPSAQVCLDTMDANLAVWEGIACRTHTPVDKAALLQRTAWQRYALPREVGANDAASEVDDISLV